MDVLLVFKQLPKALQQQLRHSSSPPVALLSDRPLTVPLLSLQPPEIALCPSIIADAPSQDTSTQSRSKSNSAPCQWPRAPWIRYLRTDRARYPPQTRTCGSAARRARRGTERGGRRGSRR